MKIKTCWLLTAIATVLHAADGIPADKMREIYETVKTPYKYGVIMEPEEGKMLDNPNVFRYGDAWYMTYIVFDNKGYETMLAKSADLLHWQPLGPILLRGAKGAWDCEQADGGPSLFDVRWDGSNTLGMHDGKYWMTYIGGAKTGYETDPLAIGVATTDDPSVAKLWTRASDKPVLAPDDPDRRWFEDVTLFKSYVVTDEARSLGGKYVMYYNAKHGGEADKPDSAPWLEAIGIALSDDMLNWKRYGKEPVILNRDTENSPALSGDPMIKKIGDVWVMFYFGYQWGPFKRNAGDTFAVSRDLVNWTKWEGTPLIFPSEPWDRTHAHKPWVLKHDGVVYHFYCAVGDKGRVLALATSKPVGDNIVDIGADTWVATDGLGRKLPMAAEVGLPRTNRTVAVFYFMTHGQKSHMNYGPYDITKILAADPDALNKPDSKLWGPLHHGHYWGEPLFGYYRSDDKAVIKKHAQMLADAGVDAIALDFSNGFNYPVARTALLDAFAEVRAAGGKTPKVFFLLPFRWAPSKETQNKFQYESLVNIYREVYAKGFHPELWFHWKGKPLIMAYPSYAKVSDDPAEQKAIENFFTFRKPFPTGNGKPGPPGVNKFLGHWAWREIHPQSEWYDFDGNFEQMTVSVSQNNNAEKTVASTDPTCFSRAHCKGKDIITPENIARGLNFQEQWDYALEKDPPFIFVTGWNEWGAARMTEFLGVKQPVVFADNFDAARSRDAEPVKGHFGDAYYWQLIANIRRYKGVRAIEMVKSRPIRIDGDFADWAEVAPSFRDTPGDPVSRDFDLCGKAGRYVDHSGRNDIVEAKVSVDAEGVCFYVATADKLIKGAPENWMCLFVDTDADASTGNWLGYELTILPGKPAPEIQVSIGEREIELRVPFSFFKDGKKPDQFDFKWADNCLVDREWSDFTLHGDAAPNDRYNYRAILLER